MIWVVASKRKILQILIFIIRRLFESLLLFLLIIIMYLSSTHNYETLRAVDHSCIIELLVVAGLKGRSTAVGRHGQEGCCPRPPLDARVRRSAGWLPRNSKSEKRRKQAVSSQEVGRARRCGRATEERRRISGVCSGRARRCGRATEERRRTRAVVHRTAFGRCAPLNLGKTPSLKSTGAGFVGITCSGAIQTDRH